MKLSLPVALLFLLCYSICANAQDLQVHIDLSEAEAMLSAAKASRDNNQIGNAQLESILRTSAAKHLSGTHTLTADSIKRYAADTEISTQIDELQFSLREWRIASLQQIEHRVGQYLPSEGQISLTVIVVLAPGFTVAEFDTASIPPRVFVPLLPSMFHMRIETYVGEQVYLLASAIPAKALHPHYDQMTDSVRLAVGYTTEFRRGIALLAGDGSIGLHICATCPLAERQQWDNNLAEFSKDLLVLDKLLLTTALAESDIEGQRLKLDAIDAVQWQVVGYRMAVMIERHYGRKVVPNLVRDPRMLLELYNLAAAEDNANGLSDQPLPLWSHELIRLFGLTPSRSF
jgi:hypothetical protein